MSSLSRLQGKILRVGRESSPYTFSIFPGNGFSLSYFSRRMNNLNRHDDKSLAYYWGRDLITPALICLTENVKEQVYLKPEFSFGRQLKSHLEKKTNENSCSETIKVMVQFIMTCFNNHWFLGNCLYAVVKLVNQFDRNDIILTELARYGVL